jgi:hypothetical protein
LPSGLISHKGQSHFFSILLIMVSTSLHSLLDGVCHDWNASQSSKPQASAYFSLKNRLNSSRLIWLIATKISSGSDVRYCAGLPCCAVILQGLAGENPFAEADLTLHLIGE